MKKHLLLLSFVLLFSGLKAQLPNPGFETLNDNNTISNWGNVYLFAIGFDSTGGHPDSLVFDGGVLYGPTSDAHNGDHALLLNNAFNYTTGIGMAGAVTADQDNFFNAWGAFETVPVEERPGEFSFYYKYSPVNGDTGYAALTVFDSSMNEIGKAVHFLNGSNEAYSYASEVVEFTTVGTAAFMMCQFSTFYTVAYGLRQPGFGTRLTIDDVMIGAATELKPVDADEEETEVFPNPASSVVQIRRSTSENSPYVIYNGFGQIVKKGQLIGNLTSLSTEDLAAGIYTLEIRAKGGKSTKRMVIGK